MELFLWINFKYLSNYALLRIEAGHHLLNRRLIDNHIFYVYTWVWLNYLFLVNQANCNCENIVGF